MFGMLEENLERERREIRKKASMEGKIEIIKNMAKEKIPMETIMRITNITKEELEEILV